MSEIKLLPCPHCEDGKAMLHTNELTDKYHVTCCDCGCRTADFKHPEEAIELWNTRKSVERITGIIEDYMEDAEHYGFASALQDLLNAVKEEGGIE